VGIKLDSSTKKKMKTKSSTAKASEVQVKTHKTEEECRREM